MMHVAQAHMSEAQQIASATAIHRRLRAPQKRMKALPAPTAGQPQNVVTRLAELPLWRLEPDWFNHHVLCFRQNNSREDYLEYACAEAGVDVDVAIGPSRGALVIKLKNEIAYNLKVRFGMGFSEIARFVGADHATIAHRINSHCVANGLEHPDPMYKMTEARTAEAKRRFEAGEAIPTIAKDLGVNPETIRIRGKYDGWYITPKERRYRDFVATIDRAELVRLVRRGYAIATIAGMIKQPVRAIDRYLEEMKINMHRGG